MNLKTLAKLSGTSVATVSKAFSGANDIGTETREKIFAIAKENNIFNKYYKGPREKPIIALIFPESESEFYGRQIGLLEREIEKRGGDTVIAVTRFDPEREARLFTDLVYRMSVDGVILCGKGLNIKNTDEIPLVIIGRGAEGVRADSVISDYLGSMVELMGLIKEYGHREIGFIGERHTAYKLGLCKKAMRRHGLAVKDEYFVTTEARFAASGEVGMRELIERGKIPSAIVAAYDQIAFGAMRYATERGYKIPDDISFVGIDDIMAADYVGVPLTSLHVHFEDVCDKIVDLLFKKMDNRYYRARESLTIPITVNLRESLGKKV